MTGENNSILFQRKPFAKSLIFDYLGSRIENVVHNVRSAWLSEFREDIVEIVSS